MKQTVAEICSYKLIGKLSVFFPLGVQVDQHDRGGFLYHRGAFTDHLDAKTVSILGKVSSLLFILNIDGSPIISKSHTHPSHSQTSHLTSSLSLGVPVPRPTQCIQDM